MKILYFSTNYANNVMGTKRSIREELIRLGHNVTYYETPKMKSILSLIDKHKADQIWLAHSSSIFDTEIKQKIKIPIIGFGFSDPYYFNHKKRFPSYDAYITNHYISYEKYHKLIPMHYNPTACDFRFHKRLDIPKTIDISIIGRGKHPRFHDKNSRIDTINRLRKETKYTVHAYGPQWDKHKWNFGKVSGDEFLNVINSTKIGLDLQDDWSPLAHRMFEYSSCGTPVITRARKEVNMHMEPGKEILTYNNFNDLKKTLEYYLAHPVELENIAEAALNRCIKDHDIQNRVSGILTFLNRTF